MVRAPGGLLGAEAPTAAAPLRATLMELGGGSSLDLTVATAGDLAALQLGIAFTVNAGTGRLEAAATLAGIPLAGTAPAAVLPAAQLRLVTPASGTIVNTDAVRVGSLAAGMAWDGARMSPLLELVDVALDGTEYPRLDLTSANAVVAAASDAVRGALASALGQDGAGRALQALVGLVRPAGDAAADDGYLLDLQALVADPLRAIAQVHLKRLTEEGRDGTPAAHGWQHLFAEVAALLGIDPATREVDGTGTLADPWRVPLATEAGVALQLAAWNAAAPGAAEAQLRLGLWLAAGTAPWTVAWRGELLGFEPADERGAGASGPRGRHGHTRSMRPLASGQRPRPQVAGSSPPGAFC